MTLLPIVDRELRVAARKPNTFWVRITAALVALVIGAGFLVLNHALSFGFGRVQLGGPLFATLTWMGLAVALAAGLFFTSDCLSEEKRSGTLGFLFLTDLRGYDVVLGKLLATSVRSLFALLAVFPVLAVTLLLGGVTGPQFWKTVLALVNALMVSLAAGLVVSAVSRDSQKALGGTLLVLLLLAAGGPLLDFVTASARGRGFAPWLSLASPVYVFLQAGNWIPTPYWTGLVVNQMLVVGLLGLSSVLLPRAWQERSRKSASAVRDWSHTWKFGGAQRRQKLRERLLERNPALWLACRERWQSSLLWLLALAAAAGGASLVLLAEGGPAGWMLSRYLIGAFTWLFYLAVASQACRFSVEARQNGSLELLLTSPLTGGEIVHGQWRALLGLFGGPVLVFLGAQLVVSMFMYAGEWGRALSPGWNMAGDWTTLVLTLITALLQPLVLLVNLAALGWFGMWMGLSSKNANFATLKTLAFVQILPWFAITFASALSIPFLLMPVFLLQGNTAGNTTTITNSAMWGPFLYAAINVVLVLGKDVIFITVARRKLLGQFRALALRSLLPIPTKVLPPPPRTLPSPTGT